MASEDVCVLGAGGHAKVIIQTLQAAGYGIYGLFDDDPTQHGKLVLGHRVAGSMPQAVISGPHPSIIAVGDNTARKHIALRFPDIEWISVVHPNAYVDPSVHIGAGTVVLAGAVVQPDSVLGDHVIINTGASVDHDCTVGDFAHIAPGCHLAGQVKVGEGALMGIGGLAIPSVEIGPWATVGAGSVVIHDVDAHTVSVGNPAHCIRRC